METHHGGFPPGGFHWTNLLVHTVYSLNGNLVLHPHFEFIQGCIDKSRGAILFVKVVLDRMNTIDKLVGCNWAGEKYLF